MSVLNEWVGVFVLMELLLWSFQLNEFIYGLCKTATVYLKQYTLKECFTYPSVPYHLIRVIFWYNVSLTETGCKVFACFFLQKQGTRFLLTDVGTQMLLIVGSLAPDPVDERVEAVHVEGRVQDARVQRGEGRLHLHQVLHCGQFWLYLLFS